MLNFCTLFNEDYLTRGLAMFRSLRTHCPKFRLHVLAFDETTATVLESIGASDLTIIRLVAFEDANPELQRVKSLRNPVEYMWTCTPAILHYCLSEFKLDHCIYVDADLYFYSDPTPLVEEMGEKSVSITEHRYSRKHLKYAAISGIYCVQFLVFKNSPSGFALLEWWRDACLNWCYARYERGKFGDQKYLDCWPYVFNDVHVSYNEGGGIGPWNVERYSIRRVDGSLYISKSATGREWKVIYYHFHHLRFITPSWVSLTGRQYYIPRNAVLFFYRPYIHSLVREANLVQSLLSGKLIRPVSSQLVEGKNICRSEFRTYLRELRKALRAFVVALMKISNKSANLYRMNLLMRSYSGQRKVKEVSN